MVIYLFFSIFLALQAQRMIGGKPTPKSLSCPSGAVCPKKLRHLLRNGGCAIVVCRKLLAPMGMQKSRHFIFSILLRFNLIPELKLVRRMTGNNPVFTPNGGIILSRPNICPEHVENKELMYGDLFELFMSLSDKSPIFRYASLGMNTPIQVIGMHPSGKLFFIGCYNIHGTHSLVCYRFAENDTIVHHEVLPGHRDSVDGIAVDSAGNFMVSGSSKEVILWRISKKLDISIFGIYNFGMTTLCLAFHPKKLILAAGGWCNNASLWEVEPNGIEHRLLDLSGHKSYILDVKFLSESTVVTASADKTIIISKISSDFKKCMSFNIIRAHHDRIYSLCIDTNRRVMVSASEDKTLIFWWLSVDNSSATQIQVLDGHHYGVQQVRFDPSGRQLVSSGWNELIVWE